MKRAVSLCLAILLVFSGCSSKAEKKNTDVYDKAISSVESYYQSTGIDNIWVYLCYLNDGISSDTPSLLALKADDSASMLALKALAGKVSNGDYETAQTRLLAKQGEDGGFGYVNDTIYSMLVLDTLQSDYDRSAALNALLAAQMDTGAFAYAPEYGASVDLTGMALSALAPYKSDEKAAKAISSAIAYLKSVQLPSGGFSEFDKENACSAATVITGLMDAGEKPASADWGNLVSSFESYQMADGGFKFLLADEKADSFATYQSLMALMALRDGKSLLTIAINPMVRTQLKITGDTEVMLDTTSVFVSENDLVSNQLISVTSFKSIPLTYSNGYVKSIGSLAEYDKGAASGWTYYINGKKASKGCDKIELKAGDSVEWKYALK